MHITVVCSPAAGYNLHWGDPDPEVSRELLQGFTFCPSAPISVSSRADSAVVKLSGGGISVELRQQQNRQVNSVW